MGNLACTSRGACIVVPGEAFDPLLTLETVQRSAARRSTACRPCSSPNSRNRASREFDLTSLRTGIMAGSPCPIEVMRKVQSQMHMAEITIGYGMTETSPVSTQTSRRDPLERRVATVGRVHPHGEIKIVDAEPPASPFRAASRASSARAVTASCSATGSNETATRDAIDAAGWMHTGDLATIDDEGYVNIVGRIKDLIIRGGENIYPREVEEFLHTPPGRRSRPRSSACRARSTAKR